MAQQVPAGHVSGARPNVGPLVRRACFVAATGWLVKVGTMLWVNRTMDGKVSIKRWGPGIPFLSFEIRPGQFMRLTSTSTVALAVAMLVLLVGGLLRNRSRMHVAGWCCASLALGYSLAADIILHVLNGNYSDMRRLRWAIYLFALSVVLVGWWVIVEKPIGRWKEWRELEISHDWEHEAVS
jgi:hypothetical protein